MKARKIKDSPAVLESKAPAQAVLASDMETVQEIIGSLTPEFQASLAIHLKSVVVAMAAMADCHRRQAEDEKLLLNIEEERTSLMADLKSDKAKAECFQLTQKLQEVRKRIALHPSEREQLAGALQRAKTNFGQR